jgi:hypothetical protein
MAVSVAFVAKELTYLKLLQPIMGEFRKIGVDFILFAMDTYKGIKEYNRPNKARLIKSLGYSPTIIPYNSDAVLLQHLKKYGIRKLVSVELGLWCDRYKGFFKENQTKTYSLSYLTDSLWQGPKSMVGLDRVYYTSRFLMHMAHNLSGVKFEPNRDRCLGSPLFDQVSNLDNSAAKDVLILMPNGCDKHAFGSNKNFRGILEKFGTNLRIKSRQKQWMPSLDKSTYKDIVFDGDIMYPSAISNLFKETKATVMFYSSGIYEAVFANQYVINVIPPHLKWKWDPKKLNTYFNSGVYNHPGIVKTVTQQDVLDGKVKVEPVDRQKQLEWIAKYIGINKYFSYEMIARDILDILPKEVLDGKG